MEGRIMYILAEIMGPGDLFLTYWHYIITGVWVFAAIAEFRDKITPTCHHYSYSRPTPPEWPTETTKERVDAMIMAAIWPLRLVYFVIKAVVNFVTWPIRPTLDNWKENKDETS